jgi:hypothetical protein
VHHLLGIHPAGEALVRDDVPGSPADAAVELRGAEQVEEAVQGAALHYAHGPEVVERQQRLGPVLVDDVGEAPGDLRDRLLPADRDEVAVSGA